MMHCRSTTARMRFRRAASLLMAVVVLVASLGIATRGASAEGWPHAAVEFVNYQQNVPKPCQKALLPGAVNTCPLSGFSLNAIPTDGAAYSEAHTVCDVRWQFRNTSLVAQCGDGSPYRPPCRTV